MAADQRLGGDLQMEVGALHLDDAAKRGLKLEHENCIG
jgi:hypothetical protein